MSDKLFLNSVQLENGRLLLGFAVGTPVALSDAEKVRDLAGGFAEYAVTVTSGDDRLQIRAVADPEGRVEKVIASAEPIPDGWHTTP
jgi:hypothetical protein